MGTLSWQSFSYLLSSVVLKNLDLKHKCAVTNVNWNNLTFEFLAKDEQNLLGKTSYYLNFRTFQGLNCNCSNFIFQVLP